MKGTTLLAICGLLLSSTTVYAQDGFGTGLLIDDAAFERSVEMIPEFSNDGRRAADLPRQFSLRPFTPLPKDQGSINSCIGWAMGYAALTTQKAYRDGLTDRLAISRGAHSAMFIYNQVKEGSCMSGAYVHKAAEFLKESGTCFSEAFDFPYTQCERQPEATLVAESQQHTIRDFLGLFKKVDPAKTKVTRTKQSIAEGKPVVIGMRIKESLKKLTRQNPVWIPGGEFDKTLGGHALCVVGYNDSLGVFELMNSWGPEWADAGFFRMSYRDYAEQAFQGIQLIIEDKEWTVAEQQAITAARSAAIIKLDQAHQQQQLALVNKERATKVINLVENGSIDENNGGQQRQASNLLNEAQALLERSETEVRLADATAQQAAAVIAEAELSTAALAGDFVVRMPETDEFGTPLRGKDGTLRWRQLSPVWTTDHYELQKTNWDEGDMFQVIAERIKADTYVYLFSLDGNNKAEIHWPRNQKFAEHLRGGEVAGKGEGPLVPHSGAQIIIPGEDRVLVRENLLDDYLCLLYSRERIDNFQERVVQMREASQGTFSARLRQVFGDLMIPAEQIVYEQDQMRCRVANTGAGQIIPLVVRITNQ